MEHYIIDILESLLLPPGCLIILGVMGLGLRPLWKRESNLLLIISICGLYLLSIPILSSYLLNVLQTYPALNVQELKRQSADAIVILGGGRNRNAPEYGNDVVSALTLERVRYGAWLAKRTNLPIIVSGGRYQNEDKSEAELMRDVLQQEFNIAVRYIEGRSLTTYENAFYSVSPLQRLGYKNVYLVTHAWHMPRAMEAFEHFEIGVIAAPTAFHSVRESLGLKSILPSALDFSRSVFAVHELLGRAWYRVRYY